MAVITVSRQYGSGGDEVAARVCELLGYRYFDKHLMAQVASEMGLPSKQVVDAQEERHELLTFFDRIFGHKVTEAWVTTDASGARIVDVGELDSKRYVAMVRDLIQAACGQDNVVIMGRGGQVILRGQPGVLHVRFEAEFEERVRRVSEQQRITNPAAARDFVAGRDRAGADYIRTYYGADWNDPALYHLILNTGLWDNEAAAQVVVDAVRHLK